MSETPPDPASPSEEEWEEQTDRILSESDYDADLGTEMARDAMRVHDGVLSETEFYEKYHDRVVEEFGRDDRPLEVTTDE